MRRADLAASAVFVVLGLYVFFETADYPASLVADSPGAAFFPGLLAGLLIAFALALGAGALRSGDGGGPAPSVSASKLARSGGTLGLVVLFLLLVERADFFLLLLPLLAAVMALMGERKARALVSAPLLFVAFVYVVFFRLFGVPFPTVL